MKFKEGDKIKFKVRDEILEYKVCNTFLDYEESIGDNDEIFKKLGLDKNEFCDNIYGYTNKGGGFPEWKPGDYKAMNNIIKALLAECDKINGVTNEEVVEDSSQEDMKKETKEVKKSGTIDEIIEASIELKLGEKFKELGKEAQKVVSKELKDIVLKELKVPKKIELKIGKEKKELKGLFHKSFEEILRYIAADISMILVGPAGSGKTQIAVQCSEALGKEHYSISVNEHTSKTDFLGYTDATGKIVKTNFRKCFEEGGVFIIDEIDAANPNILTIINSALSNGFCPFPDGMIKRHEEFTCICTANTFGEGENAHYIGRNILDAATRDRFATIFVDYDKTIEKTLTSENIVSLAEELRKYFEKNSIEFVVSTRGMLRLKTLSDDPKNKLTKQDIINCLNLHNVKDNVDSIISKYASLW